MATKVENNIDSGERNAFYSFLKSLGSFSGDLSSLSCPTFFLAPVSLIEYNQYWASQPELFRAIGTQTTEQDKLLAVIKWYIAYLNAAFKRRIPEGQWDKKPFHPILGEQFHRTCSQTQMVCEQVSHDPPTTAFHVASKGVALNGHIGQTSRMAGTALVCEQTGCGLITTEHEQYLFSHPSLAVRGIWYAAPFIELMGTMYIQASFGYYACIEFSSRGWISGEINHFKCLVNKNEGSVKDVLYKIEGQWTGQSTLIDYQKRTSSLFFNVESLVPSEPVVRSIQTMGPLESRRVWHKVAEAIRTSQPVLANKEKAAIEQNQREAEKKREEQGQPWQPAYFKWQAQEPHVVQLQAMWHDTLQKKTDPVLEGNWVMLK